MRERSLVSAAVVLGRSLVVCRRRILDLPGPGRSGAARQAGPRDEQPEDRSYSVGPSIPRSGLWTKQAGRPGGRRSVGAVRCPPLRVNPGVSLTQTVVYLDLRPPLPARVLPPPRRVRQVRRTSLPTEPRIRQGAPARPDQDIRASSQVNLDRKNLGQFGSPRPRSGCGGAARLTRSEG